MWPVNSALISNSWGTRALGFSIQTRTIRIRCETLHKFAVSLEFTVGDEN